MLKDLSFLDNHVMHPKGCFYIYRSPTAVLCASYGSYLFVAAYTWQTHPPIEAVPVLYMLDHEKGEDSITIHGITTKIRKSRSIAWTPP